MHCADERESELKHSELMSTTAVSARRNTSPHSLALIRCAASRALQRHATVRTAATFCAAKTLRPISIPSSPKAVSAPVRTSAQQIAADHTEGVQIDGRSVVRRKVVRGNEPLSAWSVRHKRARRSAGRVADEPFGDPEVDHCGV